MLEIKFNGRGGQGVVVASQILGKAFFLAGQYPQCFSVFGGERRGAPVVSFLRVDSQKILLKCEIKTPNQLIFLNDDQIDLEELRSQLLPKGSLLVNTRRDPEYFKGLEDYKLGLVDCLSISSNIGLGKFINTTMLGAYCGFTKNVDIEHVLEAVSQDIPSKKEENLEAIRQAYDKVTVLEPRS